VEYTLGKIAAIILFLIVLVVLIFFADIPRVMGGEANLQQKLRQCCRSYIAHGCPYFDSTDYSSISGIICDEKTFETLEDLVNKTNTNCDSLRIFCVCV